MTFASVGLNAAGALPEPLQHLADHIGNSIVHSFGVPQAPPHTHRAAPQVVPSVSQSDVNIAPAQASNAQNPSVVIPTQPIEATAIPTVPPSDLQPTGTSHPPTVQPQLKPTRKNAKPPTPVAVVPPKKHVQKGSGTPPRVVVVVPSKKHMQTGSGTPPPTSDIPPGFPSDWRQRAKDAATARLQTCAQVSTLDADACPQLVDAASLNASPENVQWTLLGQPLAGATVVWQTQLANGSGDAPGIQVAVYGQFQMEASYTATGDENPHFAYSGGVAQATMTWDGSSFQNVSFASGSFAGPLPLGVNVPSFERPADVTESSVLAAVQAGFDGDATQDAVVSFDPLHGNFVVSGTYTITPTDDGAAAATGQYTATVVYDGTSLQLIGIARS